MLQGVQQGARVVVAMSGGVDSSVTAGLLARAGYDVVGITLQLYDHGAAVGKKGACCAGIDIYDAQQVAQKLNIPHYVLNYEERFRKKVIDSFADSYVRAETPIPCVLCNQKIKFADMLDFARDLGAAAMTTGHYIKRTVGPQGPELHVAADAARDQSYFLFTTTPDQLNFVHFPLAEYTKQETRAIAADLGLTIAQKPDSQDICFVPSGDYAGIVAKLRPEAHEAGEIVDEQGHVLGHHAGLIHFTVGQRRGLNINNRVGEENEPLYVLRLDAEKKHVVVGPAHALGQTVVHLRDMNWVSGLRPEYAAPEGFAVQVKLRSAMPAASARLLVTSPTTATLTMAEPARGVAPGQAGVIYAGTQLLGGGWIDKSSRTLS